MSGKFYVKMKIIEDNHETKFKNFTTSNHTLLTNQNYLNFSACDKKKLVKY